MMQFIFLLEACADIFAVVREAVARGDVDQAVRWLQRKKRCAREGHVKVPVARELHQHLVRRLKRILHRRLIG